LTVVVFPFTKHAAGPPASNLSLAKPQPPWARRPQGDHSSREGPGVCRLAGGGKRIRTSSPVRMDRASILSNNVDLLLATRVVRGWVWRRGAFISAPATKRASAGAPSASGLAWPWVGRCQRGGRSCALGVFAEAAFAGRNQAAFNIDRDNTAMLAIHRSSRSSGGVIIDRSRAVVNRNEFLL
jgi:hypothetical protein